MDTECDVDRSAGRAFNLSALSSLLMLVFGKGYTPLMAAAHNGQVGTVQILLNHGADSHAKLHNGDTCLELTITAGKKEIADILLRRTGK